MLKTDTKFAPWHILPLRRQEGGAPERDRARALADSLQEAAPLKVKLPPRSSKGAYNDAKTLKGRRFIKERIRHADERLVAAACVALLLLAPEAGSLTAGAPSAAAVDIDTLLAPIALYPDALLGQMLLCAANPGKVAALSEWLRSHDTLKGTDLQNAAVASGFTDSFTAIVVFPDVVDYMASR
jgi:hypothetical protein